MTSLNKELACGNRSLVDIDEEVQLMPPPLSWYDQLNELDSTVHQISDEVQIEKTEFLNSSEDNFMPINSTKSNEMAEIFTGQNMEEKNLVRKSTASVISTSELVKHIVSDIIPVAAQELIYASAQKAFYYTRSAYSTSKLFGKFHINYSELGNKVGGYDKRFIIEGIRDPETGNVLWSHKINETRKSAELCWEDEWDKARLMLPPFSSLPWVDRQLVKEWRSCDYLTFSTQAERISHEACSSTNEQHDEDSDFDRARMLLPKPISRPPWENATSCYTCRRLFGASRLRHHCRMCGRSYCQTHSRWSHRLPHLSYHPDVAERVCEPCKHVLESHNLAERIAWRMARCRDYISCSDLTPYFETGVDTVEDAAVRLTKAAIHMAKSIPLGAQAHVAVETLDVLRKHGLKGLYGLVLRKEFMAAADLLCKALGINKKVFPLSVHELSAAIYYALAEHRAIRGVDPELEHRIHALKSDITQVNVASDLEQNLVITTDAPVYEMDQVHGVDVELKLNADTFDSSTDERTESNNSEPLTVEPVCEKVSDELLSDLIFYAPLALNFIYAAKEVDMQLLAAQQGWRLLYAQINQDEETFHDHVMDKPASALFVHSEKKLACLAVRGTATINDVVTDIRAVPVQFPDVAYDHVHTDQSDDSEDDRWTSVAKSHGLALCGMASAAYNLFRENIDPIIVLAQKGYKIRLAGHSLGGSVAALLGTLIKNHIETNLSSEITVCPEMLHVYSYGSPACVDANLSDLAQSYVTNCVLHDDVIPRLTPTSIRALLKHLLYIRETWVKVHLADDLLAITERAKTAWAPRMRNGFTLMSTSNPSIKMYKKLKAKSSSMKKNIKKGKKKLRSLAAGVVPLSSSQTCSSLDDPKKLKEASLEDSTLLPGMVFEGDCFFEAEESLIETSDEESYHHDKILDSCTKNNTSESLDDWVPFDERKSVTAVTTLQNELAGTDGICLDDENNDIANAVLLEESPLPRMFIPGKIVHLYTHRGGYRAAIVPKAFKELRRISMAGSMLNDHKSKSYYEALLECKCIRQAKSELPVWTGFSQEITCSCCASRFTWASTFDNEAQEARDRHNCRACGGLVCESCSKNKCAIPDIGLLFAVRVCDRCYNNMGNSSVENSTHKLDKLNLDGHNPCLNNVSKRSSLVDELAMKMPTVA